MFDKIRILLIDDIASGFKTEALIPNFASREARALRQYFDVKWVKTPQELRAYFDLTSQVIAKDPSKALAVLPEVIGADYSLTDSKNGGFARTVEADVDAKFDAKPKAEVKTLTDVAGALALPKSDDLDAAVNAAKSGNCDALINILKDAVSPLPALRDAARKLGLPDDLIKASQNLTEPPAEVVYKVEFEDEEARDHMGAQAGALIHGLYSQHYGTAFIPHTAHSKTVNHTATAFLEWMLTYSVDNAYDVKNGAFKTKGNKATSWFPLLRDSMRKFRARTAALAETGVVRVSLDTLCRLKSAAAEMPESIRIESKFGARALPLRGLFIDFLYDDEGKLIKDEEQAKQNVREAARAWAQDIIHRLYVKNGGDSTTDPAKSTPIELGLELSKILWDRYCGPDWRELRRQRWALSNACGATLKHWQGCAIFEELKELEKKWKNALMKSAKGDLKKEDVEDARKDWKKALKWAQENKGAISDKVLEEFEEAGKRALDALQKTLENKGAISDKVLEEFENAWEKVREEGWKWALKQGGSGIPKAALQRLAEALYPVEKNDGVVDSGKLDLFKRVLVDAIKNCGEKLENVEIYRKGFKQTFGKTVDEACQNDKTEELNEKERIFYDVLAKRTLEEWATPKPDYCAIKEKIQKSLSQFFIPLAKQDEAKKVLGKYLDQFISDNDLGDFNFPLGAENSQKFYREKLNAAFGENVPDWKTVSELECMKEETLCQVISYKSDVYGEKNDAAPRGWAALFTYRRLQLATGRSKVENGVLCDALYPFPEKLILPWDPNPSDKRVGSVWNTKFLGHTVTKISKGELRPAEKEIVEAFFPNEPVEQGDAAN